MADSVGLSDRCIITWIVVATSDHPTPERTVDTVRTQIESMAMSYAFPIANRLCDLAWKSAPKGQWTCPSCGESGPFAPHLSIGGVRRHARCPHCRASERHRLAFHAFNERVAPSVSGTAPRILHFAPEPTTAEWLVELGGTYETADLFMEGVDHRVDIADLPFEDRTYDIVWASHVLAVIKDDHQALSEIRRILCAGGVAVLPIPILGGETIDYPESVAGECDNWHGPGWDYEERFRAHFDRFEWFHSSDAPATSQTFLYEDRSRWPSRAYPYRQPTAGKRHPDGIPVCWAD